MSRLSGILPGLPGMVLGRLAGRARRVNRELHQLYGPHRSSFSPAVVAAHARVQRLLPDLCRGVHEAGGAPRH